nr:bidirectional sugar transporter SWEET1-like [Ipomoea trifida]
MELLLQMEVPRKPPPQKNAKVKEKNSLRRKAAAEDSSRKTYTATLTARSKRLVIKTKSVEFMPFFLSLFVFLCGTSWFIFGLLGKDPFVAIPNGFRCGLGAVQLIFYAIYCDKKSFPDGSGKMVGVDGKPSGEDIQLGIRMGQNQSKEDLELGGFISCRALSQRNNDPTRASLPWDSVMTAMDLSWVKELEFYFWKNLSMRRFAVEGVFAGGIKQKNMAADGRNLRVPFELKASCFLRNVLVLRMWMELLLQMEVPRKPPSQERATMKPIKPEAVIVISHDTEEEVKEKNSLRRKAAAEDSSRKTYTATLTARSKAACGLNIKLPKEKIEDIDAGDVYNELAVVEYAEDIYKF